MLSPRASLLLLPALVLAGCSESDTGAGPGPTPSGPPVIEDFGSRALNNEVLHPGTVTLSWTVAGATAAAIVPEPGALSSPERGTTTVRPYRTTTYRLTASNEHGSVTDSVTVVVRYRPGFYVDPTGGDDGNSGAEPDEAIATLSEALGRTQGGGTIFLAAGVYSSPLVIDGAQISVYGGLDPVTFFEGEPAASFVTVLRPAGVTPLSVRNSPGAMEIVDVSFDARNSGPLAGEVADASVLFRRCTFDGREAAGGTALSVSGSAAVQLRQCRIFGSRPSSGGTPFLETAGVRVEGSASASITHCFVYGGRGIDVSSGVDVQTAGPVAIALCTIGAEITTPSGAGNTATAIRLRQGNAAIGGNILFTRGVGQRYGIIEEADGVDPTRLEGNLFISISGPYDNFGPDPTTEQQLNLPGYTVSSGNPDVGENLLVTSMSVTAILRDIPAGDFHLVSPVLVGGEIVPNPAVDKGDSYLGGYGVEQVDIDGDARPFSAAQYDLGADES